ncbi:PREDICTED: uncharacterized protein LOC105960413 [Erythranthe guttata]|uniref:uncharacterized protein LOC105960413 n=1 Tax=Erythranthe guttata TaxID=4155 RepID=UPI00064DBA2E|nr:PREDICTED: uncharacterized protein LOC105960413 [Erythranthe guttata]|eukprot:XP_012840039.1 PREDICTED: uncharacterized protein LOC105960413 [Erythranthe guttata]
MSFRSLLLCSLQLDFCFSFIPLIAKRRRSVLFYSAHYRTAPFQYSDLTYCPQLLTSATRSPGVRRRFARCPYHMAPLFSSSSMPRRPPRLYLKFVGPWSVSAASCAQQPASRPSASCFSCAIVKKQFFVS